MSLWGFAKSGDVEALAKSIAIATTTKSTYKQTITGVRRISIAGGCDCLLITWQVLDTGSDYSGNEWARRGCCSADHSRSRS
jgi:hypothetical protein